MKLHFRKETKLEEDIIQASIEKLKKIVTELDSRDSSSNLIYEEFYKYSWAELCDEAIKLLKNMR